MYVIGCDYDGEALDRGVGWRRFRLTVVPADHSCVLIAYMVMHDDRPGICFLEPGPLQNYMP